jgi:hypothetical protein
MPLHQALHAATCHSTIAAGRVMDIPGMPEDEEDTIFQAANIIPSKLKYRMRAASKSLGHQAFTDTVLTEKYGSDNTEGIQHFVGFNGIMSRERGTVLRKVVDS